MKLSQVQVVQLRLGAGMSAFLTDVRLGTSLFVGELQFDAVNFARVRLERTALSEGLVALVTAIRTNSYTRTTSKSYIWALLPDLNKYIHIHTYLQGGPKNWHHILYALTLPNINRFSKLFHCQNQEKICNNTVTKDPTTPHVCRYTTL